MYIPPGFGTVTPYLFVEHAERFIEFLIVAFGGEKVGWSLRPDDKIANAQVRIGSTNFMVSESSLKYPSMPGSFYLYVEDAELTLKKALGAGAVLEMDVANMPYGDRQGGVIDPVGNLWWISQRIEKTPYY